MPIRTVLLGLVLSLSFAAVARAQDLPERKQARAVRVADGAIRVDGRLDEEIWRDASPLIDFVQTEPVEGAAATDRMEVRLVFDNEALYVGARMASSTPIQAPLGRRDEADQAEHVQVSLDTYLDRRTAYTFGVTATGVRIDFYHPSDDEFEDDDTFNPVWQARTAVDADGWTAELWIPFSQLRFNDRSPQVWGLNVRRWIPSRNEEVFWSPMRRTDERWASLFGDLHGLDDIRPRRRLELLPYVGSDARVVGDRDADDPFTGGANLAARVGADVKVGIGTNLTLEAAVNPDFGQVEADPAEVNLSAFETFFDERRPFFVEGANLLTGNVNNYFYSRRIGAAPLEDLEDLDELEDADYVDFPGTTTILGAAKLTGRLASGTSIGVLGALTGEEAARTFTAPLFARVTLAPRTAYGVARVTQEVGEAGSTLGLMATAVHRDLAPGDLLASWLPRDAFTVSGDSVMRFGDYEMQANLGVSRVAGEAAALRRVQESSARYFQRPDADYLEFDPRRTAMSGAKGGLSLERQNARHWGFQVQTSFESPEFETNDIGRLSSADGFEVSGEVEYQETTPGRWYREYGITVGQENEWNFGGDRQVTRLFNDVEWTWPNYMETTLRNAYDFRRQDLRLTRGGPSMQRPAGWESSLEVESSEASETQASLLLTYGRNEDGGLLFVAEPGITLRPAPQWQLSLTPTYEREVDTLQYVETLDGGRPETFGSRYIFGHIDRSTYSAQVRLNYTFKPDLNLDFYAEPFAASGHYDHLGELLAARGRSLLTVNPATLDLDEDLDFNVRSFRSNLVLRWEWRPGSTLYLVWQQDREMEEAVRGRASVSDMFRSIGARGDNYVAVKASFWFSPR
jgi:hypothetical protein